MIQYAIFTSWSTHIWKMSNFLNSINEIKFVILHKNITGVVALALIRLHSFVCCFFSFTFSCCCLHFTKVFIMVSLYVDPKRKPSSPIFLFYPIKIGINSSFSLHLDSLSILSFESITFTRMVSCVKRHGIVV